MTKMRIEKDSLGEVEVPTEALYGAQTQRAIDNFQFSGLTMPAPFIAALLQIKLAAAKANNELGLLDSQRAKAIIAQGETLLADPEHMRHFPIDVFQTGSGTSTNMNANEVLATLATKRLGQAVSANDHVNCSQSSNDVIPTAIHVATVTQLTRQLLPALDQLLAVLQSKARGLQGYTKTGRTHLMDAMPVRMDQTLLAWAGQVEQCRQQLLQQIDWLANVALGGTAVGTGINAHPQFAQRCCNLLSASTGLHFVPAAHPFTHISAQDTVVGLSGALKVLAVAFTKIANDLRWMNSGPLAGLGEISLRALQPGSSIMPGKVNPVIPEAVAMAAAQVVGNDAAITLGGQSGNFELNVMLPMIAHNVLQSIQLLGNSASALANQAIADFSVNEERLQESLAKNPILVTALNSRIGYERAASIAKKAYREGRPIIDVALEESDIERSELVELLNPQSLTHGGVGDE